MTETTDAIRMTWKPYDSYKDSGVEWLGEVPEEWEVVKLKYAAKNTSSNVDKHTVEGEEVIRLCNYVDVYYNDFIGPDLEFMQATATLSEIRKFRLKEGDVIVTKDSESWNDIAVPAYVIQDFDDVLCGYHLAMIRPDRKILNGNYLFRAFSSSGINDQFRVASTGITRYGLGKYGLDNAMLPVPPLPEQHAIASFLDYETAQIDELIAKKERQIELLREKRSALISHAVTKGLDPNAKMKDSGIEWLGEVPEGWEVTRIKQVGNIKYGLGEPPPRNENGLLFIRATDIYRGQIKTELIQRVDPDGIPWSRNPELCKNDILVVRSGAYTGDSAIVPEELSGAIAGYDMILRVTRAIPRFVAYALLSKYLLNGQIYLEKLRAAQPHLNAEELGNCTLLLPDRAEQESIVRYLDSQTELIDRLIDKIELSIAALHEYRTALISAAVTGKIDVRGESGKGAGIRGKRGSGDRQAAVESSYDEAAR